MRALKSNWEYDNLEKMTKKIILAVTLVLMMKELPAYGIKFLVGMNSNEYLFPNEMNYLTHDQITKPCGGVALIVDFNKKLKLEVNAFLSERGAKVDILYTSGKTIAGLYRNSSISFPVLIKYKFKENASPYAAIGPELVFIRSHHLQINENKDDLNLKDLTKKTLMAFNVLIGYEQPFNRWGLFAEIRYNRWLGSFLMDPQTSVKSKAIVYLIGSVLYL